MSFKDLVRRLMPGALLGPYRSSRKALRRRALARQAARGSGLDRAGVVASLRAMGVVPGDTLLVHSSLASLGYVEGGAACVVDALLEAVGEQGNLLMPSSPNPDLQAEFVRTAPVFDVRSTPSRMGAITEAFRRRAAVRRSMHPTEPVCAHGPDAAFLTEGHFGEPTPYTDRSPFARVAELGGKILMIGVTLDNAGTNLHTLEDAVPDFKFPVYLEEAFDCKVIDEDGNAHTVRTRVHNPEYSRRRRCDELIPLFESNGVLTRHRLGGAECLLIDAAGMLETMIREYHRRGVTMYTPEGS